MRGRHVCRIRRDPDGPAGGSNAAGLGDAFSDMTVGIEGCEVRGNTVALFGEFDIATVAEVEAALADALGAAGADVIVDVSGTTFVDSITISALVEARTAADRLGRPLRLRGVGPRFERVLGLCAPQPPFERAD